MKQLNAFFKGVTYFFDGARLITQPALRRFVIVPLLVNAVLFIGLMFFAVHQFEWVTAWVHHILPSWLQWLTVIVWLVFFLVLSTVLIYLFLVVANLIAAPFNATLSLAVQSTLGHTPPKPLSWQATLKAIPEAVARECRKLLYYLPRALGLLILLVIPGIGFFAGLAWTGFNAWMMSLQYIDYPADNHHQSFQNMYQHLKRNKMLCLGFGLCVLLLSYIPVVNFLVMPIAVCGATQCYLQERMVGRGI